MNYDPSFTILCDSDDGDVIEDYDSMLALDPSTTIIIDENDFEISLREISPAQESKASLTNPLYMAITALSLLLLVKSIL